MGAGRLKVCGDQKEANYHPSGRHLVKSCLVLYNRNFFRALVARMLDKCGNPPIKNKMPNQKSDISIYLNGETNRF